MTIARYRPIKQDPARTQYKSNGPEERLRRRNNRKRLDKAGVPRYKGRGRPVGSKATTTIMFRRMLLAMEEDKVLPHEFFLLVLNKGLRGESLGVMMEDGKVKPQVITFEHMMRAAEAGIKYFAAPIRLEHAGPGGGPLQVYHIPADRLQNLDTNELMVLQTILPKLGSTVKTIEHDAGVGDAESYAREIGMASGKEA